MKVTEDTPVKVKSEVIPSDNLCGRCLYNIPQGTLLLMLPGLTLLIIGIIVVVTESQSQLTDGMLNVGIIFLVLGSIMTSVVFIFCVLSWRKHQPPAKKAHRSSSAEMASNGIELVGVYRITSSASQERMEVITVPASVTVLPASAIV